MADNDIISVDDLTKYYGETVGVQKLSFAVKAGEIFGFLGPNGAGKTTTIRLMLDLLRPSAGQIVIFDKPARSNALDIRRRCGYLPGSFTAYGHMTAAQFLRLVGNLRGVHEVSPSALLDRFKFSQYQLSQRIKHLSHGNLQKIGIVQAFFHKPELLILDEPTTGLDPLMQEEFYKLVKETQENGATIFFSSHNLPEVEKICDRVAIVRHGKLVAFEELETLRKKRYRRLRISLQKKVEPLEIAGAELLSQQDGRYEFLVKGDLHAVLKSLSDLPIEDVVFPEPDLEEVFMAYYQEKDRE
jgi:ABC-2 type transport system ATP-binding protein